MLLGQCKEACEEMRKAFPELMVVPGHVMCIWGKRGHIWLVAPNGDTIDPTRKQFPGVVEYEPWKPGDSVLIGVCMYCGHEIWKPVQSLTLDDPFGLGPCEHREFCSDACADNMARDMMAQ